MPARVSIVRSVEPFQIEGVSDVAIRVPLHETLNCLNMVASY